MPFLLDRLARVSDDEDLPDYVFQDGTKDEPNSPLNINIAPILSMTLILKRPFNRFHTSQVDSQ